MNKDEIRRLFPECCAVADEYRKVFGEGTKLVYVSENGRELGKRSEGVPVSAPSGDVSLAEDQTKRK